MFGYEERQPFLCNTLQFPTTMAAGKCNDISMLPWPFYVSPEADNCTRKPELCTLMYLGMKPTEHNPQLQKNPGESNTGLSSPFQ